jgi:hypothetical protein
MSGIFSRDTPPLSATLAHLMFEIGYIKATVIEIRKAQNFALGHHSARTPTRDCARSTATPSTRRHRYQAASARTAWKAASAKVVEFLDSFEVAMRVVAFVKRHWGLISFGASLLAQWGWPIIQRLLLAL